MEHYDIIIIGTGAGGGTLLNKLKDSGKKILVLERGKFLPQEKENWDTEAVFLKERYHTHEVWKTEGHKDLHPGTGYWVGGNTKVYGAALFRLREKDFETIQHAGGTSPEWPVKYKEFEKYYTQAEKLYHVHGKSGIDPTEPFRSEEYPNPPVSHEPRIQEIHDALVKMGHNPFYVPLGVKLNEKDPLNSACIRCDTCDGFPCLIHAKADADIDGVRPSLANSNITLLTEAKVTRLLTNASGNEIESVEVDYQGSIVKFKGDIVVVSAGAVNTAVLLLKSANDKHPKGLANGSDQVGRNFMKHQNAAMLGVSNKKNLTKFQKTMAINDFYFGEKDFQFPMGHVQLLGKANKIMLAGDAPGFTPDMVLEEMAEHSVDWWMTGEDLPAPENRVQFINGQIHLDYTDNNTKGFDRLIKKWSTIMETIDDGHSFLPHHLYLRKKIPLQGIAHQCGTARFGTDRKTSVLDTFCKTHEIENLYLVDGSFFPSSGAVNPSLTIMANALRVGEHLLGKLK
ncbi:MAG TPA: GMC family oxidoreductase [Cytophagaceae bacterium]|jgi:choline dehydrogenase-like flavoprotein|nr:GMC family oxidoreductase [Cytophagaceae bacterium]